MRSIYLQSHKGLELPSMLAIGAIGMAVAAVIAVIVVQFNNVFKARASNTLKTINDISP